MPTSNSGRDSRRSSKSSATAKAPTKGNSDRKEKAKSSQIYDTSRRPSRQAESVLRIVEERPSGKGRTNSAPLIEGVSKLRRRDEAEDEERTIKQSKTPSAPQLDGVEPVQDEDEVAGVVGAIKRFEPFQTPEVRPAALTCCNVCH